MPEVFTSWAFWYWIGGAVVALAAILLIAILAVAASIGREAERALAAARRIEENTAALRELSGALESVEAIHAGARAVAEKTAALAGAVHGAGGGAEVAR